MRSRVGARLAAEILTPTVELGDVAVIAECVGRLGDEIGA